METQNNIKAFKNLLDNLNEIQNTKGYTLFFRGHSSIIEGTIIPSIYRDDWKIRNEHLIFRDSILYSPNEFDKENTAFEKLVKMQHYGIPTRVLDITQNPLVALYFACNAKKLKNGGSDGELIIFKIPNKEIKYYDSDTVSILSNIAKMDAKFRNPIEDNEKSYNEKLGKLIHEIHAEKSYFHPIIECKDLSRVICVKAKMNNPRMIRQNGAFLLFGINDLKSQPAEINNKWIQSRIMISLSEKNNILNQLKKLNITEAFLFPELEKTSKTIVDYYKKN